MMLLGSVQSVNTNTIKDNNNLQITNSIEKCDNNESCHKCPQHGKMMKYHI